MLQHPKGGLRGLLRDVGVDVGRALKDPASMGGLKGESQGKRLEGEVQASDGGEAPQEEEEMLLSLCFPLALYAVVEAQLRKYKRNLLKKDGMVPGRSQRARPRKPKSRSG